MSAAGSPALVRALVRGEVPVEMLARLGEPEPPKSSHELGQAARAPDLAPHVELWGPPLLQSARPGYGARALREIAERYRRTRRSPLPPRCLDALAAVVGSSDFLARLLLRHPHWAEGLVDVADGGLPDDPIEPDWTSIRIAKYRGLLGIAARDLLGRPLEPSLRELTELADRCLRAGLERAAAEHEQPQPVLCALGKLGGSELNFSSDVDLLFLYAARDPEQDLARNPQVARVVQTFKRNLEAPSEDGFAYRVDLDLRPEGRTGALANSTEAALHYYETFGAEWERQALIRLRHVAGPADAAGEFRRAIEPFVFRRMIDPGAIQRVRDMKARIESERRRQGRDLDRDLKEGPGGIRDVEFFVQALQMFHGGRAPEIRSGNVRMALQQLERLRLLPEAVAEMLRQGYVWLRRAEHAVQLPEERQVHHLPADPVAQVALARRMGYRDEDGARARAQLLDDWTRVRTEVRAQFEALVLEGGDG